MYLKIKFYETIIKLGVEKYENYLFVIKVAKYTRKISENHHLHIRYMKFEAFNANG